MPAGDNDKSLNELNDVIVRINRQTLQKGYYGSVDIKYSVQDGQICNVKGDATQNFRSLEPQDKK